MQSFLGHVDRLLAFEHKGARFCPESRTEVDGTAGEGDASTTLLCVRQW